MEAVLAGADRQEMHEVLRESAMQAWAAVQAGAPNNLAQLLAADSRLTVYLRAERILDLMSDPEHTGRAPAWARELADSVDCYLTERGQAE